jgi:hypothetical protein
MSKTCVAHRSEVEMNWSFEPDPYHCSEHPTVDLTAEVRAQLEDRPWSVPGGNFFYMRARRFLFKNPSNVLTLARAPKEGPFTLNVLCPGVSGSPTKDEDKPHQEICCGEVVR